MHPLNSVQIAHLKVNKALTKVFNKHADFADNFSPKFVIELFEYTKINNYIMKLVDD